MQQGTPRRSSHRLILQNSTATDFLAPQSYSILERCRSYAALSLLGRIKLEQQVRSLSQPKSMTIKANNAYHLSKSQLLLPVELRKQPVSLFSAEILELTPQQKLVQGQLRRRNLEYQKLLVLESELDLQISSETYRKKLYVDQIQKNKSQIQQLVKLIASKKTSIRRAQNDIRLCYINIGRGLNPQDPQKQYHQMIAHRNQIKENILESKKLFEEETINYNQEICQQRQLLQDLQKRITLTQMQLETSKTKRLGLLQKKAATQFKNKIAKLQFQKLSLSVDSINEQKQQLIKWIGYIEDFLKVCQPLGEIIEFHTKCSHQIEAQTILNIRQDFSKITYEFPRLRQSIRQSETKTTKLKYKLEVKAKKISMLDAKIERCAKYISQETDVQSPEEHPL